MSIPISVGLLVLVCAPICGQDSPPAHSLSLRSHDEAADHRIEQAVRERFLRSKIAENHFTVRVHDGVAILEGKTGVSQHKGTATRLAKRAGARRVDNRITITEAGRRHSSGTRRSQPRRVHVERGRRQ